MDFVTDSILLSFLVEGNNFKNSYATLPILCCYFVCSKRIHEVSLSRNNWSGSYFKKLHAFQSWSGKLPSNLTRIPHRNGKPPGSKLEIFGIVVIFVNRITQKVLPPKDVNSFLIMCTFRSQSVRRNCVQCSLAVSQTPWQGYAIEFSRTLSAFCRDSVCGCNLLLQNCYILLSRL